MVVLRNRRQTTVWEIAKASDSRIAKPIRTTRIEKKQHKSNADKFLPSASNVESCLPFKQTALGRSSLGKLPAELRNRIYEFVFEQHDQISYKAIDRQCDRWRNRP
ncbi:hypothetical protein BAUCODRAFT_147042 [Baudoinia panamericana UAMH 10762]|uniref:Uncharacterized protein n=1 Tax=Baudoinia panamericana (strain UAMH 10762) TaxID=717646 RepID=M2NGV3_BAUPA|nr:uncharacterized protein BAUCODRAFT_147042 [Baudoinia panamericana UAMH 10762]EMC98524.1 hypothetical protein BAUCODRAFT_147042 [Baudoinia panamericana UAMH 10762]